MDLKDFATQIILQKTGSANDRNTAASALDDLASGDNGFDIGDLVGQFASSGGDMAAKAKSWLGDGANDSISASQVQQALGGEKIEAFARKLGIGADEASTSLSEILPQLVDKSSRGGELLESVGGSSGLFSIASKLFK